MDFLPQRQLAVSHSPQGAPDPERQTSTGRKPCRQLSCHQSINTFSRVAACLADRSLKNKKSLTAAEPSGCHDGTVIDIDVLSCSGSSAHRYGRETELLEGMCTNTPAHVRAHVPFGN